MLNIIKNTINRVFASGVDSDASAFITATGLSGTTQKSAITTLVKDLKASGLWSKMKAVYPMITDSRNIFSYTEDFSNPVWVPVNITITTNTATSPIGTNNADSFISTATTNPHPLVFVKTLSGTYTYSIYVKKNNSRYVSIKNVGGSANWAAAIYDLDNVVVTKTDFSTQTSVSANIQDVGNGWRRISITSTGNFTDFAIQYAPNGTSSFATYGDIVSTGTGATDYYIWGAQLESASTASTYQPILTTPAAFMASQMKYNLKDARDLDAAFRLTWSGGWTYSATGATPNGTNAYADTKLVPSASLSTSSAHFSKYNRTNDLVGNKIDGSISADSTKYMQQNYSAGNGIVGDLAALMAYTATDTRGLFTATRTSTSLSKVFRNSAQVSSSTSTIGGMSDRAMYLGARNDGTVTFYNTYQVAFSSIGDGLTDQDSFLLNQIVEKYQVALSRGVQAAQSFYYNSAYSNEANTYLYSTQITGTTQVSAINTLINGLKANNLWAKMKAVYPFVTDYRNLLSYTEDFSNVFWNKFNSTVTANTIIAPNGTLTADTLQENTTNTEHNVRTDLNGLIPSETYTYSNYVKYNDRRYMRIQVFYNGGIYPNYAATFDILNGVFVSQFGVSGATIIGSSITADNNGWYRITVSGQLGAFSSNIVVQTNLLNDSLAQVYTGTSKSTYIWGAQFELGSSATAYQPVLAANSSSTFMSSQMKFNLVNPQDSDAAFRLAFSGGWTYSTNGAQPNGTNGYADTKLIPSAALSSTNSQHYSVYSRTNIAEAKYGYGNDDVRMALKWSDNNIYAKMGTSESGFGANSTSLGLHILNRVNSSNLSVIVRGTKTTLSNSISSLSALSIALGGRQLSGSVDSYGTRQLALATIGDGLSDAEVAILNQLVTDYETTLNRNV